MNNNHLEQLIAEWYEFQGYFVRRNVNVGKRAGGGYECELDIVAFHPQKQKLVQIEPSLDASSWAVREERYKKKFKAGRKHIPQLFSGITLPDKIEQIAVFVFASKKNHPTLAGGKVLLVQDILKEIVDDVTQRAVNKNAIPEQFPLLRTIQFITHYRSEIWT
jgi:hypothetical protein